MNTRPTLKQTAKGTLRTAQTYAPWLIETKACVQRCLRQRLRRPHDPDFAALPYLNLRSAGSYVDVGANRGQSIDAIRLFMPAARIDAIEANPGLADDLVRRYGDVTVHQVAVGDEAGELELHVPVYRGFVFDGLASLDREEAARWLAADALWRFNPGLLELRAHQCTVVKIDDLDLAPDFMKLDIQGFEHQALCGAVATITKHRPALMVEAPTRETDAMLDGFGYTADVWTGRELVPRSRPSKNVFYRCAA